VPSSLRQRALVWYGKFANHFVGKITSRKRVIAGTIAPTKLNRTKIKISKLEAARRQVETAIRIYFANGDPVSIHTLAAASLQILVDLDKKGTLWDFIETQVKPEHVSEVKKLFAEAENFFKHAERDPDKILEFPLAEPEVFLWKCVAKYPVLAGEVPLLMLAYRTWFLIHHSDILKPESRAIVNFSGLSIDFPETDRARFFEYILPVLETREMAQKQ
jgi:hypothetical protein